MPPIRSHSMVMARISDWNTPGEMALRRRLLLVESGMGTWMGAFDERSARQSLWIVFQEEADAEERLVGWSSSGVLCRIKDTALARRVQLLYQLLFARIAQGGHERLGQDAQLTIAAANFARSAGLFLGQIDLVANLVCLGLRR